jgi:hypothetical protein
MFDSLTNYFWQHPVAIVAAVLAAIIVLIWMTGSGSRQRFVSFNRSKEIDQLSRDLSRIAAALERIARSQESQPTPADYLGRSAPSAWEGAAATGERPDEIPQPVSVPPNGEPDFSREASDAPDRADAPAPNSARAPSGGFVNPLGGTAGLLGGKKKLDLPNPLYRPK